MMSRPHRSDVYNSAVTVLPKRQDRATWTFVQERRTCRAVQGASLGVTQVLSHEPVQCREVHNTTNHTRARLSREAIHDSKVRKCFLVHPTAELARQRT